MCTYHTTQACSFTDGRFIVGQGCVSNYMPHEARTFCQKSGTSPFRTARKSQAESRKPIALPQRAVVHLKPMHGHAFPSLLHGINEATDVTHLQCTSEPLHI